MTRAGAALVLALVALAVTVLASPAWAHTALTASDPAAGATLDTAPGQISLSFSGLVRADGSTVTVTGGAGASVTFGVPSAVGNTLTMPVRGLTSGVHQVVWRVIAGDGHAINGEFSFTVAAPLVSTTPAPTPASTPATTAAAVPSTSTAPAPSPDDTGSTRDDGGGGHGWIIAVVGAGIAAVALAVAAVLISRRRSSRRQP